MPFYFKIKAREPFTQFSTKINNCIKCIDTSWDSSITIKHEVKSFQSDQRFQFSYFLMI
jgi:hypothetical protein